MRTACASMRVHVCPRHRSPRCLPVLALSHRALAGVKCWTFPGSQYGTPGKCSPPNIGQNPTPPYTGTPCVPVKGNARDKNVNASCHLKSTIPTMCACLSASVLFSWCMRLHVRACVDACASVPEADGRLYHTHAISSRTLARAPPRCALPSSPKGITSTYARARIGCYGLCCSVARFDVLSDSTTIQVEYPSTVPQGAGHDATFQHWPTEI
jgi:hypothetical protein